MSHHPISSTPANGVSVVFVNWNTRHLTEAAVVSLRAWEKSTPLEIIIVDNASSDGSADYFEKVFPTARIIRSPVNEGFARGNNRGVDAATGRYVLLLNTDTISHEEVLPSCLNVLKSHAPAVVGCRLLNPDGSLQLSAERFPRLGTLAREVFMTSAMAQAAKLESLPLPGQGPTPVDWLCGAFLFLERETYLRLGGLSSEIFMYGEDMEFCWRASKHGVRSVYLPDVSITHLGGGGINHGSLRSLMISDAGRLKAFSLMKGRRSAFMLRLLLMTRSAVRLVGWGLRGFLGGDSKKSRMAKNHGREFLNLLGLRARGA